MALQVRLGERDAARVAGDVVVGVQRPQGQALRGHLQPQALCLDAGLGRLHLAEQRAGVEQQLRHAHIEVGVHVRRHVHPGALDQGALAAKAGVDLREQGAAYLGARALGLGPAIGTGLQAGMGQHRLAHLLAEGERVLRAGARRLPEVGNQLGHVLPAEGVDEVVDARRRRRCDGRLLRVHGPRPCAARKREQAGDKTGNRR